MYVSSFFHQLEEIIKRGGCLSLFFHSLLTNNKPPVHKQKANPFELAFLPIIVIFWEKFKYSDK